MATASQPVAHNIDWRQLIKLPPARRFPRGSVIAEQGQNVTQVYFLGQGLLKVSRHDRHGNDHMLKLITTPGHVVGAACAVLDTHITTLTALTDSTIHIMSASRFLRLLKKDTLLSWQLHQMQCLDLLALVSEMTQGRHHSVRLRMEALLRQLVPALGFSTSDKDVLLKLPLRYTEIADFFSVTPEHLSRVVRQMDREGVIQRNQDQILIPDPNLLYSDLALLESN